MAYKYYTRTYYSTVCHILEFDPKEFRLDISLGVYGKLESLPKMTGEPKDDEKVIAKMNGGFTNVDGSAGDIYSTFVDNGLYYHPACPGYPTLVYWKDNTMTFELDPDQKRLSYYQANAYWAIGVGWTLIVDGKVDYTFDKQRLIAEFGHPYTKNPRSMIGQKADGTIVMVVTNGRQTGSAGLTTPNMSTIMMELGCKIAANMDGGGSSEMIIDNKTVNKLQDNYHRPLGTAFFVYGPKDNDQIVVKVQDVRYSPYKDGVVANASTVYVRTGPGTSYSRLGVVSKGTTLKVTGANSTGKWYRFKNDKYPEGWIRSSYVDIIEKVKVTKTATTDLYLREGPTSKDKAIAVIPKGAAVEILDDSSKWYKVKYMNITGYSYSTYLK